LLIAAEHDAVIPAGVVERYLESATAAQARRLFTVEGCGHMVFTELRERDPAAMAAVVELIVGELRAP
jgi:pimeloyl-ACP methyl ester carboxylesterase